MDTGCCPRRARRSLTTACAVLLSVSVWIAGSLPAMADVGHVKLFAMPQPAHRAWAITSGPGRNVWFLADGWIGRITHPGGITRYPMHKGYFAYTGITTGSDGNLWFPEWNAAGEPFIGRMTPRGAVTDFVVPNKADGGRITRGPDGNVWFTARGGRIGRITPTGSVRLFDIPRQASADAITAGPDGSVWFTELSPARVAKITPGGVISEYDVPEDMRPDHLSGITTGPDGNIWFTDVHGNGLISYMRPDGTFGGSWRPKGTSSPVGITTGPDDTLWYVANGGKVVGRFLLDGKVTVYHLVDESSYVRDTIALGGDGDLWVPVGNTTYAIARVDGS